MEDPIEKIETGIHRITAEVGDARLVRLRDSPPDFFEEAVVQLLLTSAYGGTDRRGRRIGGTGSGALTR